MSISYRSNRDPDLLGGCANEHFVEATLLFSLHKVKSHVQSAPTTKPCNTGLEGGSGSTFKSHKTFLGNQCELSYELAKPQKW